MLKIDGKIYEISTELPMYATGFLREEYQKLDENFQFILKPIAREILRRMEKSARDKEQEWSHFRPEKKSDPVDHLIRVFGKIIWGLMMYGDIELDVDKCNIIQTITIAGKSGRPLASDGNIRVGEDNCSQVS
jgi:hypothetical protein